MRRTIILLAAVLCVTALAACGKATSSQKQTGAAVEKAVKSDPNTAKAKAAAEACVKKGGGFKAEFHCAIPKGHGLAFVKCVLNHKPANVRNDAADVQVLEDCGVQNR